MFPLRSLLLLTALAAPHATQLHAHRAGASPVRPQRRARFMTLSDLPPLPQIRSQSHRRVETVQVQCDVQEPIRRVLSGEARGAVCLGAVDRQKNVTSVEECVPLLEEGDLAKAEASAKEKGLSIVGYLSNSHETSKDAIPFTAEQYVTGCKVREHARHKDQFCVLSLFGDPKSGAVMLEAFQITDPGVQMYEEGQVLDPQPNIPRVQQSPKPTREQQLSPSGNRIRPIKAVSNNHSNRVVLKDPVLVEGIETREVDAVLFCIHVGIRDGTQTSVTAE